MAPSFQAKGQQSVARLEAWLAAGYTVPRRQGKVHRAALCRTLGIVRSTLGSNPALRELIASLDAQASPVVATQSSSTADETSPLERELARLHAENAVLRRRLREVTLLLGQGRCLR